MRTLLVARAGLGTKNNTFLSWNYMKSMGEEPMGIVKNGIEGKDLSERTTPLIIRELAGLKPLEITKVEGLILPSEYRNLLAELVGF